MLLLFKRGQTSIVLRVKILDSSSSEGEGLTGLAYNSSGLIISTIADSEAAPTVYTVTAGNIETIATLGTYAAPTAGKCRFKEVDSVNHPGVYEIQIADARFDVASAKSIVISIHGPTDCAETDCLVPLVDRDPYISNDAAAVADAVWDEAVAGHTTADTYGAYLDAKISTIATGGIDAEDLAEACWSYSTRTLTQTAAQAAEAMSGSTLTILRGDTLSVSLTGLGSIADRSKLWLTVKRNVDLLDAAADVQIEESAGLLRINGGDPADSDNGSLVVDDDDAGNITYTVSGVETANLDAWTRGRWDIQVRRDTGELQTLMTGKAAVERDVTRTIA